MKPYYRADTVTVYNGDALSVLPEIAESSVDLLIVDPPYFRVKDEWWDRQWDSSKGFLTWIGKLCEQWQRILKPNGSLYVFASPGMNYEVEGQIRQYFNVLNTIRWYKQEGWHNKADEEILRSYLTPWEAIIFAEHKGADNIAKDEAGYEANCKILHKQVYAPIGRVVMQRRLNAGLARHEIDTVCAPSKKPTGLCYRWEEGACLPTEEQFVNFCQLCGDKRTDEALRSEYEALRSEYEALRRPFNAAAEAMSYDLWNFPTVTPYPGKHPCEKPQSLLKHIIRTSSRPGATVLDCCMGSGSTLKAARALGRQGIGVEISETWCRRAVLDLQQSLMFMEVEPELSTEFKKTCPRQIELGI